MATLPSYVKILEGGYGEESDYGVLRTEMDGGIAKQRPRWSKAIVTRDVTLEVYGTTEKANFDAWVKADLNGGAGWFDWVDPLDPVNNDASTKIKLTRIKEGKYKWGEPNGPIWQATCQIETIG